MYENEGLHQIEVTFLVEFVLENDQSKKINVHLKSMKTVPIL